MKNVKKALLIAVLAVYVCMQSACGNNDEKNPDDMAGGATTESSAAATPSPSPSPSPSATPEANTNTTNENHTTDSDN